MDDIRPASEPGQLRLGSTTAVLLASQVVALAASFATSVLLARALGPDGKGVVTFLLQVPGTIMTFASFGIPAANAYFVGRRIHGVPTVFANSLLAALIVGAVGVPITLLLTVGPLAAFRVSPGVALLTCAMLPLSLLHSNVAGILTGLQKVRLGAIASTAGAVGATLIVLVAFALESVSVAVGVGSSAAITLIALAIIVPSLRPLKLQRPDFSAFRESAGYSLRSYLGNLVGFLNYRQDVFVVGYLAGSKALGLYSIAVTFAELMWYLPNALSTAILSKSLTAETKASAQFTARSNRITLLSMIAMAIVLGAAIRPILSYVYTPSYLPASGAFFLLLPGIFSLGVVKVLSGYLAANGKLFPGLGAIAAGLNLGLNLLLVPSMGIGGAALASTVSYGYLSFALMRRFRDHTGIPVRELLLANAGDVAAVRDSVATYLRRRTA